MRCVTVSCLFSVLAVYYLLSSAQSFMMSTEGPNFTSIMMDQKEHGTRENTRLANTGRVKRAVYNSTDYNWPDQITYMFEKNFPTDRKELIQRTMREIMDNVCVKWKEVPNFDPSNYVKRTNSYLFFRNGRKNECYAEFGQGNSKSKRIVSPCQHYEIILHMLLHTLGVVHEFQGPKSQQHITLNTDKMEDGPHSESRYLDLHDKVVSSEFDGSSLMMFHPPGYKDVEAMSPMRDEEFSLDSERVVNKANIFYDLNQVYKCKERHCSHMTTDCGIGDLRYIKGECRCVCPDGFDNKTNCATLDDANSGPDYWPDLSLTLFVPKKKSCPLQFKSGYLNITGKPLIREPPTFFAEKAYLKLCSRQVPTDLKSNDHLPMGIYCLIKPADQDCYDGFEERSNKVKLRKADIQGHNIDIKIDGKNRKELTLKWCCNMDRLWHHELEFPRKTAFNLFLDNSALSNCPLVKGMRSAGKTIVLKAYNRSVLPILYCIFSPGVYGCNKQVTLNANNRKKTITIQRTANQRCLYHFNVPEDARIKVTIDKFDIHDKDFFFVRRFNKWSKPYRNFPRNFQKQFISEKDFMFIEYWASIQESDKDGIEFTAEVLLKEDLCYNERDRGRSYKGTKSVTENFEECLPWTNAIDCHDFPFDSSDALHLLSISNYCRNPGGLMLQPWCYVNVDRGSCRKQYCDVCNNLNDDDIIKDCEKLKKEDKQFCTKALQRFKCAKTCNLNVNVDPPKDTASCGKPTLPRDGVSSSQLQNQYNVGDVVTVSCKTNTLTVTSIECTMEGWTRLRSACEECPQNGVRHKGQCVFFNPNLVTFAQADAYCKSFKARQFVAEDVKDMALIQNFQSGMRRSWVNAKLSDEGLWEIVDDECNSAISNIKWLPNAKKNDEALSCAVLHLEKNNNGKRGLVESVSCDEALAQTFCETIIPTTYVCKDKYPKCQDILEKDPSFCSRVESTSLSSRYCEKSCGRCDSRNNPKCMASHSSSSKAITVGEFMEFDCNEGQYYQGGERQRACGFGGKLLGTPLKCARRGVSVDIGVHGVKKWYSEQLLDFFSVGSKDNTLTSAVLFDMDGFRVPFTGRLTHWHFYTKTTGQATFFVYRKRKKSGKYWLRGFNVIDMQTKDMRYTVYIHPKDQIKVRKGDMYGVYVPFSGMIYARYCRNENEAFHLRVDNAESVYNEEALKKLEFKSKRCVWPSVGIRVKSYNSDDLLLEEENDNDSPTTLIILKEKYTF